MSTIKIRKSQRGFLLIEAIAAVLIVSVCLTLMTQGLWTNARSGMNFSRHVKTLLVMEDAFAMVSFANQGRGLQLPKERLSSAHDLMVTQHGISDTLDSVNLRISPADGAQGHVLDVATIVYNKPSGQEGMYAP